MWSCTDNKTDKTEPYVADFTVFFFKLNQLLRKIKSRVLINKSINQ